MALILSYSQYREQPMSPLWHDHIFFEPFGHCFHLFKRWRVWEREVLATNLGYAKLVFLSEVFAVRSGQPLKLETRTVVLNVPLHLPCEMVGNPLCSVSNIILGIMAAIQFPITG